MVFDNARLRSRLFTLAVLAGSSFLAGGEEIAPYVPAPRPVEKRSFLTPDEIEISRPGGEKLLPAKFTTVRDLAGLWKFRGLRTSARPFKSDVNLNRGYQNSDYDDSSWSEIKVPLNWYNDPNYSYRKYHNPETPFVLAWYRKEFELSPEDLAGRRVRLNFDVIGYEGLVFVNGKKAGTAHGDFVPSSFDVTDLVKPGRNVMAIRVFSDFQAKSSSGISNYRTYGAKWWYENVKGGLWQPVSLTLEPEIRFDKVLVAVDYDARELDIRGTIENHTQDPRSLDLSAFVTDADRENANQLDSTGQFGTVKLAPGKTPFAVRLKLRNPKPWAPRDPNLYFLTMTLTDGDRIVSARPVRFGFRRFEVDGQKFRLNGKPIYLFGENLASTLFGGYDRSPAEERQLLEKEIKARLAAGVVMLRTAHMPATRLVIEVADELGMMIYDEWSYSFSIPNMDEPRFEKTNSDELARFIERDFNAPSVVMWSLGNEVTHGTRPEAFRQLSRQIALVREIDFQKRPIVPFSGVAGIAQYGSGKFDADVLDLHSYLGLVDRPWSHFIGEMGNNAAAVNRIYGPDKPLITWECIGYTWGMRSDRNFKIGDLDAYLKYATRKFSWAEPYGIGYAAANGLAATLDPQRSNNYLMDRQAGRILDLYRQDPRYQGFAPWCMPVGLPQETRWNQPVYATLRIGQDHLPPRNLFTGDSFTGELFLTNDAPERLDNASLRLTISDGKEQEVELFREELPVVDPGSRHLRKVTFRIPENLAAPAPWQLRLTVTGRDGQEISRNYANVNLEPGTLRNMQVKTTVRIALLDAGGDAEKLASILKAMQVPFRRKKPGETLNDVDTLLIPPGLSGKPFRADAAPIRAWVEGGGCLVILEQLPGAFPVFNSFLCANEPNTLADLVLPEHPLFHGMTQEQFDLWSCAEKGNVFDAALMPLTDNVLAAKPPFLVRTTVAAAILEARVGSGRLIASQLNACRLWNRESAANRYLANLIGYAGNRPLWDGARPLAPMTPPTYQANPDDLCFINLAPYANRSFTDEVDNDGKGGWLDQGTNDFRMMPLGRITAGGIPFEIIDPAGNDGKSCLIVRGEARKEFPAAIRGIAVNAKLSRLFFLHTSGWGNSNSCGVYRIHYEDGSFIDYPLRGNRNIGDWWIVRQLPEAKIGFTRPNRSGNQVGFFTAEWVNPEPQKSIATIDFLSAMQEGLGGVDWVNPSSSVPVLAAMTGERAGIPPCPIHAGRDNRQSGRGMAWRGGKSPGIQVVTTGKGAPAPYAMRFELPEGINNGVPVVSTKFDAPNAPENARYLVGWIKTDMPGVIDFAFPSKDWKTVRTATLELNTPGEWIRFRLALDRDFHFTGAPFKLREGRSEFYLYNGLNQQKSYPRTAVTFELTGLALE